MGVTQVELRYTSGTKWCCRIWASRGGGVVQAQVLMLVTVGEGCWGGNWLHPTQFNMCAAWVHPPMHAL